MAIAPDDMEQLGGGRDRALVDAHRHGDPDAFTVIVADHYRMLLAQAQRRLGSRTEAEDAVQEVFERAFRAIDRFGGEYRLAAWLSLITSNVCASHGARRIAERRLPERVGMRRIVPAPDAAESLSDPAVLAVVRAAIDALPSSQRNTFVLHEVGGLSYPQVADRLGISEANARARVHRAKATLRRNLDGVRNALGGFVALPLAAHALASQLGHRAGRVGHRVGASGQPPTPPACPPVYPAVGSELVPGGTTPLATCSGAAQSVTGFQQAAGQLVSQVASSPLGQAVLSAAPVPRGSLVMGLAAGLAAVTTATLAAPGGGALPAAAAVRPSVVTSGTPASSVSSVVPVATASSTPSTNAPVSTPTVVPVPAVVSTSASGTGRTSSSALAQAGSPHVPAWIATAQTAVTTSTGSAGSTPAGTGGTPGGSGGPSSSGSSTGGSSAGGSVPSTQPAVAAGAPGCPWLWAFAGASPGEISSSGPINGTPIAVLGTSPALLTSNSTNPVFQVNASITPTGPAGIKTPVTILAGTCLPPTEGVLLVDMTGPNSTEVQLRGSLVSTSGDPSDAGYLFRGTVVPLTGDTTSGLPWGLADHFVAQLLIREPANTAELSLAFLGAPPTASTSTSSSVSTDASAAVTPTSGTGAVTGSPGNGTPPVEDPSATPASREATTPTPTALSPNDSSAGASGTGASASTPAP